MQMMHEDDSPPFVNIINIKMSAFQVRAKRLYEAPTTQRVEGQMVTWQGRGYLHC